MTSHLEEGILHELLDGEIPSPELPPLQAHLAACAECRARLEEARGLQAMSEGLLERLDEPEAAPRPRRERAVQIHRYSWKRNLAWAATLVIAVGTGYYGGRGGSIAAGGGTIILGPRQESASVPAADQKKAVVPADSPIITMPAAETTQRQVLADQPSPRDAAEVEAGASVGKSAAAERKAERDEFRSADQLAGRADSVAGAPRIQLRETSPVNAPRADLARLNEELVATGSLTAQRSMAKVSAVPDTITFPEALRRLNGMLRLIEGLVPDRLEAVGQDVRVVYPLVTGELYLTQRLVNGRVEYRLIGPTGLSGDSLQRLRARIRE